MIPNGYAHKEGKDLVILIEFDKPWRNKREYYMQCTKIIQLENATLSGGSRVAVRWRGVLLYGKVVHKSVDFSEVGAGPSNVTNQGTLFHYYFIYSLLVISVV